MSTIGVGTVGMGWMGRLHSQSYKRLLYHYPDLGVSPRLVVASDTAEQRRREAKEELGYERVTESWQEVVEDPEVEVVSITAPNYLHREIALACCKAGKHFWVEKPLGRGPQETIEVAQAALSAGVRTAVGFNYRLAPIVEHAHHLLATGELGKVIHVRGFFLNDYAADPRGALSWRFVRDLAGWGASGDLLSHVVDLLEYLVAPIEAVSATHATFIQERPRLEMGHGTHFALIEDGPKAPVENEDYVAGVARFANGAFGLLEASRVTIGPRCQVGFELHCSNGAVSWDFERMGEMRLCKGTTGLDHGYTTVAAGPGHGDFGHFQPGPAVAMSYDDLKVIEAARFLTSVTTGRHRGAGVAEAAGVAAVLWAMERSAASGRWEEVVRPRLPKPE
jgi:predicted dehydrogenase